MNEKMSKPIQIELTWCWALLEMVAQMRDEQKTPYESSKLWSIGNSTHFIGLCGEATFAQWAKKPLDVQLKASGDEGHDFIVNGKTIDVKTTVYWDDPILKEFEGRKKSADLLVLAGLDLKRKRCILYGWTTLSEMHGLPRMDFGYGKRLAATTSDLVPMNEMKKCV